MYLNPDEAIRSMGQATRYGDWPELVRIAQALQHHHDQGGAAPSLYLQAEHNTNLVPSETPRPDSEWAW